MKHKRDSELLLQTRCGSLPTSWLLAGEFGASFGLALLVGSGACLFTSSPEESAILRRLSVGEDTDEVLRLLLAAGAYLCMERCLFLSFLLSGLRVLFDAVTLGLMSRSLVRLRL